MAELDRLITLTIDTGGTREAGHYVPNNIQATVWARRTDTGAERLLTAQGARGQLRRTYRVALAAGPWRRRGDRPSCRSG